MTPGARLAAALDVLADVLPAAVNGGPTAEALLARDLKARRYAGAKDRRAIADLLFLLLRHWPTAEGLGAASHARRGAIAVLGHHAPDLLALFGADRYAPAPLTTDEIPLTVLSPLPASAAAGLPAWLWPPFEARFGADAMAEAQALMSRPPLHLRVNALKANRNAAIAALAEDGIVATPGPWLETCLEVPPGSRVEASRAYLDGLVEVQDAGSQLVCALVDARPGETIIDLCAGAGGKTLALAAAMAGQGRLLASDVDPRRLEPMRPRLARAGARATLVSTDLVGAYQGQVDAVLVDAPCSGSGTWRRQPDGKLRLTPERLSALVATQQDLIERAFHLAKPGGRVVYAVCSLLAAEGPDHLRHPWPGTPVDMQVTVDPFGLAADATTGSLTLTPHRHGCDGFFIACWRKPC
jgi:16S rRNA (cytosine967-C5)-methyltransferase